MLIINAYFDSCNMDATSGANALIVNDSRFRGSEVIANNLINMIEEWRAARDEFRTPFALL